MKKFSKLLAVLLTIAVVICPMTSAIVANATAPAGGYSLTVIDENTAALTITSEDGFLVYMATVQIADAATKFDFTYDSDGYDKGLKVIDYSLKAGSTGTKWDTYTNPVPSANLSGNNLTFIVSARDETNLDLYTSMTIYIHLADSTTVALTNLQAADEGETPSDDPTLLGFDNVAADGTVSQSENPAATPAATHDHDTAGEAEVVTAPGCTTTGSYYDTCSVCGERQGVLQTSAALGHSYGAWSHVENSNPAQHSRTCSRCLAVETENCNSLGTTPGTAAGCEQTGTTDANYCTVCNFVTAASTTIPATGHSFTNYVYNDDATCIADGTETASCDHGCGTSDTRTKAGTATGVHTWGEYVSNGDATCTVDGTKTATCTLCHDATNTVTDTGSATGHSFTSYVYNNDATCTTGGTKTAHCDNGCGTDDTIADLEHPATGHNLSYVSNGDGTHTVSCSNYGCPGGFETSESCDTEGEDGACSKCGYKEAAAVCEHAHKTVVSATPATTESDGSITFHCDDCDQTLDPERVIWRQKSTFATPKVGMSDATQIILRSSKANYNNAGGSDGVILVTQTFANGSEPEDFYLYMSEVDGETEGAALRWVIPVKTTNYTDIYTVNFFSYCNGDWTSGTTKEYSIEAVAFDIAQGQYDLIDRQVAANMLKMGAIAQQVYVPQIAPADRCDRLLVGDYAALVTTTTPSCAQTVSNYSHVPASSVAGQNKVAFTTPSILLKDQIAIKLTVNPKNYDGSVDGITLRVSYTASNGALIEDEIESYVADNKTQFNIPLKANNLRSAITVQVYSGEVAISPEAIYSVESILSLNKGQGIDSLIDAILNYSDSVVAFVDK